MSHHHIHSSADESQPTSLHRRMREQTFRNVNKAIIDIGVSRPEKERVKHIATQVHFHWLKAHAHTQVETETIEAHAEHAVLIALNWELHLPEILEAVTSALHDPIPVDEMTTSELVREHLIHHVLDHVENVLENHGVTLQAALAWSGNHCNIAAGAKQLIHDHAERGIETSERRARYLLTEAIKALRHDHMLRKAAHLVFA